MTILMVKEDEMFKLLKAKLSEQYGLLSKAEESARLIEAVEDYVERGLKADYSLAA